MMEYNMKRIFLSSGLTLAALFLLSCGKGGVGNPFGSSDPLDGLPEHIRNAKPGFEKPINEGLSENEMPISSNQSYFLFFEGVQGEAVVSGRVLRDKYIAQLAIQNISDFPGASFDPTTGTFRWNPALGIVPDSSDMTERNLRVQMIAKSPDGREVVSKTRDFPVLIQKVGIRAAIVGHNLNTAFVREGSALSFDVEVLYRGVPNQPQPPDLRVQVEKPTNPWDADLSKYVTSAGAATQSRADANRWTYRFEIDLSEAELTKSSRDFKFKVAFVNPQGLSSTPQEFQVEVRTDLSAIISTEERGAIEVNPGKTVTRDLVFLDPGDEGKLTASLIGPAQLPAGMTVNCRSGNSTAIHICTVTWAVDPTQANATFVDLEFKAVSQSPIWNDSYFVEDKFNMYFRVVAP